MDTELITYEAVRRDPELLRALINKAHRERAETMHRLIVVPIKALFTGQLASLGARRAPGLSDHGATPNA